MKAYGYIRCSKEDQTNSPEVQLKQIVDYYRNTLHPLGYEMGDQDIHADVGVSGAIHIGKRPNGSILMSKIKPKDCLIVSKLDRFSRSMVDIAVTVDQLVQKGIRFVTIDMSVDTATPTGKMFLYFLGAFAQFERERISERTRDALASIRKFCASKDLYPSQGVPWGYEAIPVGDRLILFPKFLEQTIGDRVQQMKANGLCNRLIAKNLNQTRTAVPLSRRKGSGRFSSDRWRADDVRSVLDMLDTFPMGNVPLQYYSDYIKKPIETKELVSQRMVTVPMDTGIVFGAEMMEII